MKYRQRRPTDTHFHPRQGSVTADLLKLAADQFACCFAEPNTDPEILDADDVVRYQKQLDLSSPSWFCARVLIMINEHTTRKMIREAKDAGAIGGKVYPWRVTNNSDNGVRDYGKLDEPLSAAQEERFPIQFHGETPCREQDTSREIEKLGVLGQFKGVNPDNEPSMDRSRVFVRTIFTDIVRSYPRLPVSLEHISTKDEVEFINHAPSNVVGGIAPPYMLMSQDDLLGKTLVPAVFCKPVFKNPADVEAVRNAALSGNRQFLLGSDTAFHDAVKKTRYDGCAAGNFSALALMPALVQIFDAYGKLDLLQAFTAENFSHHYNLAPSDGALELERVPFVIPKVIPVGNEHGIPWLGGLTLDWKVVW